MHIIVLAHKQADLCIEKLAHTRQEYFDTMNTLLFHFFKTFYTTTYQQALQHVYSQSSFSAEAEEICLLSTARNTFQIA